MKQPPVTWPESEPYPLVWTGLGRVPWRKVRWGSAHEAEDLEHNEDLASAFTDATMADDLCIALNLLGWKIMPTNLDNAARWPMCKRHELTPTWAESVDEQEARLHSGDTWCLRETPLRPDFARDHQRPQLTLVDGKEDDDGKKGGDDPDKPAA